ncbi:hypothetical protein M8C21_026590 [Ambrosia artemisiifolia]|uniref:Uncharacterized protein n=1 Tax=Ambrosia artemisiifolia TaxID=4212 RepID=A0AAD5GUJ1_AMBAR|nr:hypothetical protein M8C21_026590 [Ambrosia artemisiifolia]
MFARLNSLPIGVSRLCLMHELLSSPISFYYGVTIELTSRTCTLANKLDFQDLSYCCLFVLLPTESDHCALLYIVFCKIELTSRTCTLAKHLNYNMVLIAEKILDD